MSEEESDVDFQSKKTRQQLQQFLQRDDINILLDSGNILISFLLMYVYIHSTYDPLPFQTLTWAAFNTFFHILLLIEWIFKMYAAKNLFVYIMSQESIVSTFSLVPYFVIKLSLLKIFVEDDDKANILANLCILLRGLEFDRVKKYLDSEVNKQLTSILVSITTLVIAAAGAIHYNALFIDSPEHYKFHYFIYFVMTTISTMGYENRFSSTASRVLIIILVIFALTFVPIQSGELIRHLSSKSYYARINYKASNAIPHIVILGSLSTNAAENFFKELFHQDHGLTQKHAIILSPHRPDPALEALIRSPEYSNVIYIQGDPHLDKDLKRCSLEKAKAVILMCNKQCADPSAEDSKTILLAIIIKSYLKQHLPPGSKLRFCMQVLRHEGKTHYFLSLNKQAKLDQVICIEELKMSLLAKACLCPGLIAFFANLITSSGNPPETLNIEWLNQYWNGQGFEIYKTQLPQFFRGKTFAQTVLILYKKFQVILFGLELVTQDQEKILLNPGDLPLPSQNIYKLMGYIISQDKETADLITNYKSGDPKIIPQRTDGTSKRLVPEENRRSKRQTIFQTLQTYLGFKKQEKPQRKVPLRPKDHTFILPNRALGGWIKMRSFNPSTDTLIQNKDVDENMINEEEEEAEQDITDIQMKQKFRQDNLRNFLQVDFNKIYQTCHLTNEKVNLKDITCKTLEDSILAQKHVILCGLVTNLIHFIVPLRQKYLNNYPPIVILNEIEPTEKQWNQICLFPEIYYVKGTAMNQRDLIRANLMKATKVVILSPKVEDISNAKFDDDQQEIDQTETIQQLSKDQEDLLDARTIFKYRNIIRLKPSIQIVTEFVSPSNIQFLLFDKDYSLMKQFGYNQTPLFASGQIYFASVMDSLLCQSYYNPALVTVLYNLLVSNGNNQPSGPTSKEKGSVNNNTMTNTTYKDQFADVVPSNLFQMHVPIAFLGKPFEKLFYFLVKIKQIVPLAIYRLAGSTDNKTPYICTNPEPTTIINSKDLLLVLAQEMPTNDYINWGGPLEMKTQQQNTTFNVFQKQTTTSSDENEIILINDDNDKEVQKAKQFNSETELVLRKIQACIEDVVKLSDESKQLQELMQGRQDRIIKQMKDIFVEELNSIWQKKNEISQNLTYKSSDD